MGLFSRKRGRVFAERELEFNRSLLQKSIVKLSEDLYAYRSDPGHEVFANYLRQLLNLEILQMSEGKKVDAEAFAYCRGRVDAIRHALNLREKFILDKKAIREAKVGKTNSDHESKRSYVRSPSTQAGLSI